MSDSRPKRTAREPGRSEPERSEPGPSEIASGAAVPTETALTIIPEPANAPEAASVLPAAVLPAAVLPAAILPAAISEPKSAAMSVPIVQAAAAADDAWTALADAQAALARGFEQVAVEMTGMTRSGMAATTNAAIALLGARTFAEAVEINGGLARRGVDALIEGSAKLSEIGVKAVAEASRPMLSRFGRA
jgi:hypothetical protein